MDQNEILMTLLSKACHNFWKESREVVLKKSIIKKRKIVVNPLTDPKRLRLIKLQKMYKYIDVSLHIGTEEIELTTFEYFIFFLANPSLLGRFGNEYPNFKEICYDFELQEPIQNIFVREESIQEDDLNKVREVLFDAFTINEVSISEYYQNPKHTIIGSLDPDEDKKAKKKRLKDLQGLVTTREKVKILKIDRDDFNQFESGNIIISISLKSNSDSGIKEYIFIRNEVPLSLVSYVKIYKGCRQWYLLRCPRKLLDINLRVLIYLEPSHCLGGKSPS